MDQAQDRVTAGVATATATQASMSDVPKADDCQSEDEEAVLVVLDVPTSEGREGEGSIHQEAGAMG